METLDILLKIVKVVQGIVITVFFITLIGTGVRINKILNQVEVEIVNTSNELNKTLNETTNTLKSLQTVPLIVEETRKDLFKQTKSIERNLFARVDHIENELFSQTQQIVDSTDNALFNLNRASFSVEKNSETLNSVLLETNKNLKSINEYMDCESNSFCWPNLTQDTLISIRNVAQDANKTYLLLNESIPKYNEMMLNITNNTTEITKNVAKLTKPKWYDRLLSTTIAGAAIYVSATK